MLISTKGVAEHWGPFHGCTTEIYGLNKETVHDAESLHDDPALIKWC